ncbi:MAG: hypothetical protein J0H06_16575, partial [Actinobacteria bacterium]|nr:hypothetical protein [Actinomycetota bacterium]
ARTAYERAGSLSPSLAVPSAEAGHAATAGDAQTLGGRTAAQILAAAMPTCPTGTKLERGLCFGTAPRGPSVLATAVGTCAAENRQLPTCVEGKVRWAFTAQILGGAFTIGTKSGNEAPPDRCVPAPT